MFYLMFYEKQIIFMFILWVWGMSNHGESSSDRDPAQDSPIRLIEEMGDNNQNV